MNRASNFFCIAICCYSAIAFAADNSQFEVGKPVDPKYVSILTYLQKQPEKGELVAYKTSGSESDNRFFKVGKVIGSREEQSNVLLQGFLGTLLFNSQLYKIYTLGRPLDEQELMSFSEDENKLKNGQLVGYKGEGSFFYVGKIKNEIIDGQYAVSTGLNCGSAFVLGELKKLVNARTESE